MMGIISETSVSVDLFYIFLPLAKEPKFQPHLPVTTSILLPSAIIIQLMKENCYYSIKLAYA
jgi:hypothetical protein